MTTNSVAFDAVNQKAAAILRKITAYDVPLIPLENDTSSYPPIYWFKKKGKKWLYYIVNEANSTRVSGRRMMMRLFTQPFSVAWIIMHCSTLSCGGSTTARIRIGNTTISWRNVSILRTPNGNTADALNMMTENTQSLMQTITKTFPPPNKSK